MGKHMKAISRAMARRSIRLLDMEYKPSEISEELACRQEWVMLAIRNNAPSRKDESGRYWIHGEKFAAWLDEAKRKERVKIQSNKCYCVGCKKYTIYKVTGRNGNRVSGTCAKGHNISIFTNKGEK